MFRAKSSLGRKGRALLLLTVLGGLIAGDGSDISSLLGLLRPSAAQAAGTTQAPSPYTPPSGKYVDPAQFLATPAAPPVSKPPVGLRIDPSTPHGYMDGRSQEQPALRTAKARTFLNPDGTYTTRTYATPVNWKDASGHWQMIDNTLVTRSDGRLHNTSGPLDVSLTPNAASGADVLAVQAGGASVGFGAPSGIASSAASVASSNAEYYGALPKADLHYGVTGGTVKEDIILHAAPGGGADAVYRFPLHAKGVTLRQEPNGGVGLYDASGNEALVIPPGTMMDSYVDPHLGSGATAPVQVSLDQSGATPVVVVTASGTWLADPARVYPVTIDPSVSIGRNSWEGDDYVTNAYPNNYYAWQADDQIGYYNSSTGTNRTLLGYDITPIVGKRIISATWNGYFDWNYWISASSQYFIRPITAGWSLTATWNTQPPASPTYIVDSAARNQWRSVDMTGWAVNWANGSWGFAGLRVDEGGYETNQTYWKKLAGDTSANPSYIQVTYQSYASSWSFYNSASDPSSDPVNHPPFRGPAANTSTSMPVWVQNNGTDTWYASKYHPSYHLLDSAGNPISYDHTRSTLPGDLAPGQGAWVTATIDGMNPGSYILRWDVVDDTDGFWASSFGGSTSDFRVFVGPPPAPQGPVDKTVITEAERSTLSTTLTGGSVPYATQYRFDASADPSFSASAAVTSGWVAGQTSWQVPPGGLRDGTTYNWHAIAADQFGSSTAYSTVPTFTMDSYQLGMRPTWPSHAVGIGGGASAAVNLATGNLALSLPGISRATVSQPLSLAPTYNSQAVRIGAWIDDRIPYGLPPGGDPSWPVDTAPSAHAFSGQWSLHVPAPNGCHVQSYGNLCAVYLLGSGTTTESLQLPQGSSLEVYTYVNPANAPQELMMQLHLKATNTWAQPYWGPNIIGSGTQVAAALPATGKWVRLLIPASSLGTGDLTIDGISPAMIGGEAWFDHIGLARPGLGLGFQFGTDGGGGQSMRLDAFDVTGLDLTSLPSGDARRSNRIDRVEVHEGDSTTWEFHNQAAAGAPPQLVPPAGLTAILLQHPADSTWTLTDPSGDTSTFSTAGVMTTMDVDSNRSGSGPAFSYAFDTTVFPARLTTITDPLGRKATYAYGASGSALADRVASVTMWDGRKLSFGYDEGTGQAAGQLTSVTDEEGHATRLGYQAAGLVGTVTSPMGRATTIGYGSATTLDWVMQIQQPATTVPSPAAAPLTTFTYASGKTDVKDPACTADSTTCPNGYTQEVLFDGRHRTTLTRDALTNASTVSYDAQDRPILAVDAAGVWTDSAYDDSGHALTTITPVEAQNWGAGTGLYAEYYGNPQLAGLPLLTRNDATVDASWNGASPGAPVPAAGWSARWTGYVNVPSAGSYSFTVTGADGVRLRVGANLVVDQWANRGAGTFSGTVTLPVGNVPIRLEYSDVNTAASQLHLSMNGTVIAQSGLTAVRFSTSRTVYDTDVNGNALLGLRGAYYSGALSGVRPVALRTDFATQALDANLGGSFTLPAGVSQPYSARWTGLLSVPTATTYSLALAADGNARLYLDGSLVVDWWTHASGYQTSPAATPTLSAGTHALLIEYQEAGTSGGRLQLLMNGSTVASSSLTPNYGLTTLGIAPDGSQTQMVYTGGGLDAAYGLETDSYKTNTDKDNVVTQYHWTTTYNAYGQVATTNSPKGNADPTPANYLRSYAYFASGQNAGLLQSETIAGRGTTTYDYEGPLGGSNATSSSGRMITKIDQRGTWHYTHAEDGSTSSVTPPGQSPTVTTFDADGNTLRVDDPVNGSATTAYDELGRAYTYSVYDTPGLSQPSAQASATYDLDGRLKTSTDAAGAVTYTYDPRGLVSTIADPAGRQVTITYDVAGKPLDTTLFNVAIVKQRYDALGRQVSLQNHKVAGDVAIADYSVGGYDLSGRITSVTQTDGGVHPAATTSYTYDTIGRLATWTDSGNVLHRYYFDLESNRTRQVDGPTTTHQYTYASDATSQLLTVDSNAYTYDPLGTGDVVGRPADGSSRPAAQTLAWDSSGNLTAVTSADGSSVTFVRDALGRVRERVQRDGTPTHVVTADTVYRFANNGDSPSYELDQLHGGAMKSYLDGAAVVYAGNRSGTPTFLFSDIHGNTVATADQNGTQTGTIATYDPFGVSLAANSANPTSFGFVGKFEKYTDPFASLVLMGARPYDPGLGRFLAVDPVEHGSANDYDYTNQDPINGYDLNGQFSIFGHSVSCDWCGHAVHVVAHAAKATASWAWDHQDAISAIAMFIPLVDEVDAAVLAVKAASAAYKAFRTTEAGLKVGDAIAGSRALGVGSRLLGVGKGLNRIGGRTGGWHAGWGRYGGRYVLRIGKPGARTAQNHIDILYTHRRFR